MSALEALLLGVVQGLTEFLPVSSSGHLVLAQALLGIQSSGIVFEILLHGATLLAVLVFYRARLLALGAGLLRREPEAWTYTGKLALATVPAVLLTLALRETLEAQFDRPVTAGLGLLATGAILWTTRWTLPRAAGPVPSWSAAWWIGCAQALAILPGVSRSGATVGAALALGVAPIQAAEFSFLMSIAAVGGALVLSASDLAAVAGAGSAVPLALGFTAALAAGLAALALFVRLLRTKSFHRFAYYAWALGALALLLTW